MRLQSILALFFAFLVCPMLTSAQLSVTIAPPKTVGQKAVTKLELKNSYAEKIESARATLFLLDDQGKVVGQATQWVIGGTKERPALEPGKETVFNFVVPTEKAFTTIRLTFTRLILEGGKSVDATKGVVIQK
jgi:hypothetical protein